MVGSQFLIRPSLHSTASYAESNATGGEWSGTAHSTSGFSQAGASPNPTAVRAEVPALPPSWSYGAGCRRLGVSREHSQVRQGCNREFRFTGLRRTKELRPAGKKMWPGCTSLTRSWLTGVAEPVSPLGSDILRVSTLRITCQAWSERYQNHPNTRSWGGPLLLAQGKLDSLTPLGC